MLRRTEHEVNGDLFAHLHISRTCFRDGASMSRYLPPLKFKCMYEHCRNLSLENHAVCRLHLNFEIMLTAIIGFASVAGLIWFLTRFH